MAKEDKEDKRIGILEAAGKVFYNQGFDGAKMEDIAKEAGIGKGTLYEYFVSKKQLFEEMMVYNQKRYLAGIVEAIRSGSNFREKFIALAKHQVRLVKEHAGILEQMAYFRGVSREFGALLVEQDVKFSEILKKMVLEAKENGEIRPEVDLDISVAIITGTIIHYCCKNVLFYNTDPQSIDYDRLWEVVMKGIG